METDKPSAYSDISRRSLLKRSGVALAGVATSAGTLGTIGGVARADHEPNYVKVTSSDGSTQFNYEIWVTGDIWKYSGTETNDHDNGRWISGSLWGGEDIYAYTGAVELVYVDGDGNHTYYVNQQHDLGTYQVSIYTSGGNRDAYYNWHQTDIISPRNDSLESDDSVSGSVATGYVRTGTDEFYASGSLEYLYCESKDQGLYWRADY
ncbi:hypothetical protein [Halomarina pelagica]|uniref:hypothetical protein n=1 Tax=Halomarina pelagica TaxID=2961599 RepID=UPI0020C45284|nr:hypothetical protein [Halomarina sp. BND7]